MVAFDRILFIMMDLLFLLALFVQNVAGGNAIGAIGRIGALTIQPPDGSFVALERGSESGTLVMSIRASVTSLPYCPDLTLIALPNGVPESEAALRMPLGADGAACACTFHLHNVQPGTHVMEFIVRYSSNNSSNNNDPIMMRKTIHLEVVPFSLSATKYIPSRPSARPPATSSSSSSSSSRNPIQVLIVGTLSLDGQKTIWLEQMARLSKSEFSFKFACFVCSDRMVSDQIVAKSGMAHALHKLGVPIVTRNGFDINRSIAAAPGFPQSATAILRRWHHFRRFPDLISFSPEELSFIQAFKECFIIDVCDDVDILVFANSRSMNDHFLLEAARMSNVKRVVMELPNLQPAAGLLESGNIDAFVAPSEFALAKVLATAQTRNNRIETRDTSVNNRFRIIPPGIDTRNMFVNNRAQAPPSRRFRIGFVARLAPEKSPGIFLKTAREIVTRMTADTASISVSMLPSFEFLVVGDGPLRAYLEALGHRLLVSEKDAYAGAPGVDVSLRFLGWLSREDLASTFLPSLDVLVNPSLRSSETFCIGNIESMAVGTPIISLGSAGVGAYLNRKTNGTAGLVVGTNAGEDSDHDGGQWPSLLADLAVSVLRSTVAKRAALRQSSRRVAEAYDSAVMVSRYAELYRGLLSSTQNGGSGWRVLFRRAQLSTAGDVFKSMAKSEIFKLKIDVQEAKAALGSLVHTGDAVDTFAILMRGAVLGLTRFPILAHIPESARWYSLELDPAEIAQFRILNETSWWTEFGKCPTIGSAASNVAKISTTLKCSKGRHCAQIVNMMQPSIRAKLDRSIIGVATSWDAIENGGVTIIDGNHRGIGFVVDEAASHRGRPLKMFLGIDKRFGRGWKGNFWCGVKNVNHTGTGTGTV